PFISHTTTRPSGCCHIRSGLPSPLKSALPISLHSIPAAYRERESPAYVVPFISQTTVLPVGCCQSRSGLPFWSKSPSTFAVPVVKFHHVPPLAWVVPMVFC